MLQQDFLLHVLQAQCQYMPTFLQYVWYVPGYNVFGMYQNYELQKIQKSV